jgi:hypothetical protein
MVSDEAGCAKVVVSKPAPSAIAQLRTAVDRIAVVLEPGVGAAGQVEHEIADRAPGHVDRVDPGETVGAWRRRSPA